MKPGRIPDRVWTANDISRLNERARKLLLEGKPPGEVSGIVGSDVFTLSALLHLAREDYRGAGHWQQSLNRYRAECRMPPKNEAHPLVWLRGAGVAVTLKGGKVHLEPPEGFPADRWPKCIDYAKRHKPELLEALRMEGRAA